MFTRSEERITSRQVAYVLQKYAYSKGIDVKSSHKMRKTFASNLNANGVPIDEIREILGHSSLSTTLNYLFNPLTEEETYERIKASLWIIFKHLQISRIKRNHENDHFRPLSWSQTEARYGNRTRLSSLGSSHTTDVLIVRYVISYHFSRIVQEEFIENPPYHHGTADLFVL